MSKSKFYDSIKTSVIEKDVEQVYNQGISLYFPDTDILHDFGCDAFIDTKTADRGKMLKLIIEYKFDKDMKSRMERAKVVAQVLAYIKRFEWDGKILPNVCMVGDINECFVFHTNEILKWLDEDADWTAAPSRMAELNMPLVAKMASDESFNPFIFDIDENFSFKTVADKINDLANNIQRYVHVTEHNIATIFEYFTRNVYIKDKNKNLNANDIVAVFMGVITDKDNYYAHPTKKGVLVTPRGEVKVNDGGLKSFASYFNRTYTPRERNKFSEISDRLIEDTNRRHKGEFYTPTLFVDYAHRMIEKSLGEDWKEKFVVFDCCCGSLNLTRDYRFKELYASTLEQAELEVGSRYNQEATKFVFDFLNDDLDSLPKGLLEAFEQDKPIVFFINPPYATAATKLGVEGESKQGCAVSTMNTQMKQEGYGSASQNLYAQFLYRIIKTKELYGLTNVHIAVFCPTLFLTGPAWAKFRGKFLNNYEFNKGVVFKASHFADCSDSWGISFSIWSHGVTSDKNNFPYTLIDVNEDGEITEVGRKDIYNIDGLISASAWCKEPVKSLKTSTGVAVLSALRHCTDATPMRGSNFEGNIGYYFNNSNNVDMNAQKVALFSATYGNGNGHGLHRDNFTRCTALFSARKLVACNWINSKDEYMKPNVEHPSYREFELDSVALSIFHSASNQSSLRDIEYKGKTWNIKNEFFFMSKEEMLELANNNNLDETYVDASTDTDRYAYTFLQEHWSELSEEAKAVLNKARELVIASMPYRKLFNEDHENYQILNWDCGFYQLKALWKEYLPQEYKVFDGLVKALGNKMLPMVYELGFLRK